MISKEGIYIETDRFNQQEVIRYNPEGFFDECEAFYAFTSPDRV
ncbi:MAG: hypothetical protein ABEN55_03750 [Bradymonadaceae bacterium]